MTCREELKEAYTAIRATREALLKLERSMGEDDRWISVEEALPEDGQPVWMWTPKYKRQYTVTAPLKPDATHWQPLPKPPQVIS
jgi:hypothetical protein